MKMMIMMVIRLVMMMMTMLILSVVKMALLFKGGEVRLQNKDTVAASSPISNDLLIMIRFG